MKQLAGVFNVISTPLDNSDEIDQKILKQEIDWLIKCGSNGAVLAMVSEVLRFSAAERRRQWQLSLEYLSGRIPLVVSVGAESSAIAVALAKDAEKDGATAVMATPPSAFIATADEVKNYYQRIIEAVESGENSEFSNVNQLTDSDSNKFEVISIDISGFTDSIGTFEYNKHLSTLRASETLKILKNIGIRCNNINLSGNGYNFPYRSELYLNRRIEIEFKVRIK